MAQQGREKVKQSELDGTAQACDLPAALTEEELCDLIPSIEEFHTFSVGMKQCSSQLVQQVQAPKHLVWSVVRRFDTPQTYKHFIKSCVVKGEGEEGEVKVGCLRDVVVISGLPASTSTERLEILDEDRCVIGFSITGGEHRLRNYRSVTTLHEYKREGRLWTAVVESYVVDVPDGNTVDDTRLFADTVVKLNLQKLASITEAMAAHSPAV